MLRYMAGSHKDGYKISKEKYKCKEKSRSCEDALMS